MDLKDIQELIKFVAKSGATEVDLEIDNVKISIKSPPKKRRGEKDDPTIPTIIQQAPELPNIPVASIKQTTQEQEESNPSIQDASDKKVGEDKESNYITIKSSMIGTFYRSSSPDKPPFVNVGDDIKVGDIICIVEAMKLFNEIESEISGKIIKVLVDDSTPVEFDQPLFLVDPA